MKKSRTILRILAALMAVMLMTMSGAPALAASFKAKINSSSAKVYKVPSSSSKIYVQGGKGITVTVTGYANGWARIKYNGRTGYTPVRNLNLVNRPKGYTKKSTPVYRQDSTSSTRMGTLSMGSTVYVVGVSGNFYRVQNASGTVTGYVQKGTLATKSAMVAAYNKYKAYLASKLESSVTTKPSGGSSSTVTKPSTGGSSSSGSTSTGGSSTGGSTSGGSSSENLSTVDKLIQEALTYIGTSYNSLNCSQYVKKVFETFKYDMKSTAKDQYADSRYQLITSLSDIKKGDILCFDTTESDDAADGKMVCDHTAIYYGYNTFLESSQVAGKVKTGTLTDWYRSRFMGARRVF